MIAIHYLYRKMSDITTKQAEDSAFADFFTAICKDDEAPAIEMASAAWHHGANPVRRRAIDLLAKLQERLGLSENKFPSKTGALADLLASMMNEGPAWAQLVASAIPGMCWACQIAVIKRIDGPAVLAIEEALPGYCSKGLGGAPVAFATMLSVGALTDETLLDSLDKAASIAATRRSRGTPLEIQRQQSGILKHESGFALEATSIYPAWRERAWEAYWRQHAQNALRLPRVLELSLGEGQDPFASIPLGIETAPELPELLSMVAMGAIAEESIASSEALRRMGRWLARRPGLGVDLGKSSRRALAAGERGANRDDSHASLYLSHGGDAQGWLEGLNESARIIAAVAGERRCAVAREPAPSLFASRACNWPSAIAAVAQGLAEGGAPAPIFALRSFEPAASSRGGVRAINLAKAVVFQDIQGAEGKAFSLLPIAWALASGAEVGAEALEWAMRAATPADEAACAGLAKSLKSQPQASAEIEALAVALACKSQKADLGKKAGPRL